jgi:pimeloyl-ACP methyl ester carboxylesterase
MSNFVLVHGAWQGASTWDTIVPRLQTAGHAVFVPILTGLGEDSHRLSSVVNLDSHIEDVTGLLKGENLYSVTLVGHSYAGMVITGVAERESGRLNRLIYVDASCQTTENQRSICFPKPFKTPFESRLMQMGKVGDCPPGRACWTRGVYNPAPHASMCVRGCVILAYGVSSRSSVAVKCGCKDPKDVHCGCRPELPSATRV